MTRPYLPSNGTEGMVFIDEFCDRCEKDAEGRYKQRGGCAILMKSLCGEQPAEWIADDDGKNPRCTAFEAESRP